MLIQIPAVAEPTPTRIPSYGPNGTHWPGQLSGIVTPFMHDETVPNRIEVDCDWAAIKAAVDGLTVSQVNAGVLILVRPGTLVGKGAGGGDAQTLDQLGNASWPKRVTICPRDGFGSITITNGVRFKRIRNICFAGFIYTGKTRIVSSTRFALAWSLTEGKTKVEGVLADEPNPEKWELVEFVLNTSGKDAEDPLQFQSFNGLGRHIRGNVLDGVYFAPSYLPIGSSAHQDTMQNLGFSNWSFENTIFRDSAFFGSGDSAVNGGLHSSTFRNCWISGDLRFQKNRYPLPGGAEMGQYPSINNGTVSNITFDGGVYMGSLRSNTNADSNPYRTVINGAKINSLPTGSRAPVNGAWIVDTTMDGHTNPGYPPLPTKSYLQNIWKKGATPPTGKTALPPVFFPPGDVYDSQQLVSISSATNGAVIRYTTDGSEPTASSPIYSSPFTISAPTTLKAFATSKDLEDSSVSSASFDIRVIAPVILPGGGEFLFPQAASITTPTSGATIHYTLDGSDPTISSNIYSAGIPIASSLTLKAIAIKAGLPASLVEQADFLIGGASFDLTEDWTNLAINSQNSSFDISYTCIPATSNVDAVTGVGGRTVENFSDLACIVRFAPSGIVDARDGSSYRSNTTLNYRANKLYRVRMSINLATKRYSATVTPDGESPVVVANNYAFRTEQSSLSEIQTFAFLRVGNGSLKIQSIAIGESLLVGPSAPKGLRILR